MKKIGAFVVAMLVFGLGAFALAFVFKPTSHPQRQTAFILTLLMVAVAIVAAGVWWTTLSDGRPSGTDEDREEAP